MLSNWHQIGAPNESFLGIDLQADSARLYKLENGIQKKTDIKTKIKTRDQG